MGYCLCSTSNELSSFTVVGSIFVETWQELGWGGRVCLRRRPTEGAQVLSPLQKTLPEGSEHLCLVPLIIFLGKHFQPQMGKELIPVPEHCSLLSSLEKKIKY